VAAIFRSDPGNEVGALISKTWVDSVFASGGQWVREAYLEACATLGATLTWDPDGSGIAVDIDERGGLVVSTANGSTTLRSGEVTTIRRV
jgi:biotin-(acetyl-CoA carboxylase) ligase